MELDGPSWRGCEEANLSLGLYDGSNFRLISISWNCMCARACPHASWCVCLLLVASAGAIMIAGNPGMLIEKLTHASVFGVCVCVCVCEGEIETKRRGRGV